MIMYVKYNVFDFFTLTAMYFWFIPRMLIINREIERV